jgi:Uma2 family endonuclease
MGTTTTLVTVQEFLALPEPDGQRMELIGGEVASMGLAGYPHEVTKRNLFIILAFWLHQRPIGAAFCETGFQLDEQNCVIPDVCVVPLNRIVPGSAGLFQGAPELAIEVVSSETAARLEEKIELYLARGSKSVWVVFPETRVVRVFDIQGGSKKFEQDQTLEDPALPGFSALVSAVFEGV